MSATELVALVDRDGAVVGSAERSVVRRDNLLHAATAVLVRDRGGRLFVHRRSDTKDWAPGHHDAAVGGVLQHGEEPEGSALRELAEEVGIVGAVLRPLRAGLYEDASLRCWEYCYETTWDGPVSFRDGEVAWGAWMELEELGALLARDDWAFVPDTRALLEQLAREGVEDYGRLRTGPPTQSS